MKPHIRTLTMLTLLSVHLLACDQTKADFPKTSNSAGECGEWYPGGENDGGPVAYEVEEGETFPCFVWESIHVAGEDTWLNIGELHLQVKHGNSDAKALIIPVVGTNCAGCEMLVEALADMHEEFDEVAVMLALTHGNFASSEVFPLEDAVSAIQDKGWPEYWYITNDEENHFPIDDYNGIPWVVVIRLSDMEVVSRSNMIYAASNVQELLSFVEAL